MAALFAAHREAAAADGNRALELVRPRAERVVLLGFSAGGRLVSEALVSPGPVCPDAAAIVYLPSVRAEVPAGPPLFLAAAADDPLGISGTVDLLRSWSSAGRPVEAHVYPAGGHGFGMRRQGLPSDGWIERFGEWLGRLS